MLISAENGNARQLTSAPKEEVDAFPTFSPDGRDLLFVACTAQTRDCDLHLVELNRDLSPRATPRRITDEHANARVGTGLAWTANGREAIWSISRTGFFEGTLFRIPVFEKASLQPLPFVGRNVYSPALARHRNRLVYARSSLDFHIWRADGHTTERHPVSSTEVEYNPQFSPDGKRIAFESDRSGPEEIWVANSDGTEPMQLTHFGRHCGSPRWSPDGRWITFDAYMVSGRWDLWAVDSNGGTPRELTNGLGSSTVPSFSHDGKWVYFANDRSGRAEIFRAPFRGGTTVQVTHSGGGSPQESANGQTVYYLKSGSWRTPSALYEASISGGEERPSGVNVMGPTFEVMANGIYFIAPADKNENGREIRFYDFATHRSRLIQDLGDANFYRACRIP